MAAEGGIMPDRHARTPADTTRCAAWEDRARVALAAVGWQASLRRRYPGVDFAADLSGEIYQATWEERWAHPGTRLVLITAHSPGDLTVKLRKPKPGWGPPRLSDPERPGWRPPG